MLFVPEWCRGAYETGASFIYRGVDKEGQTIATVAALQKAKLLPQELIVRTHRYLNNLIEQDHRRVKQRVRPMPGFKRLAYATITPAGIDLVLQMKKSQFAASALCSPQPRTPQVEEAILAA
jgi:transposase-like protein